MIEKRFAGRLPHWRLDGGLYFVTFRLHDALPFHLVQSIREWVKQQEVETERKLGRPLTPIERERLRRLEAGRLERALDEGHGDCILNRPGAAKVVADIIQRGNEYRLHAYAVMPNHAHALLAPKPGIELSDVLGGWKSISARELIRLLGVSAPVWQKESFDHLVRSPAKADQFRQYILSNPSKAHLRDWPYVGSNDLGYDGIVWPFDEGAPPA